MRNFKSVVQSNTKQSSGVWMNIRRMNLLENIFIIILAFYPLRHISWGLDLWDTGYNYANFQYMGTEHMDPMWLFSTYLSNAVGNLLTKLPNGDTLMGMNFYTGLFASLLALVGYFFCTRTLKMPKPIVFLGEMLALSLCWCPTALLYNYVTYVSFLFLCIFLYLGLVKDKGHLLFIAGVFLGINVLVRFSNLPEAGMIVAVWAYHVILWLEARKSGEKRKLWPGLIRHTGWCLAGFLAALFVLFTYIQLRYGLDAYIAGISRLFGMTDTATDYKPASMIRGMFDTYIQHLYWVIRIVVIAFMGVASFLVRGVVKRFSGKVRICWSATILLLTGIFFGYQFARGKFPGWTFFLQVEGVLLLLSLLIVALGWWNEKLSKVLWIGATAAMVLWLYYNRFASFYFYSYDSMLHPGVLFLMLTMLIAIIRIGRGIFGGRSPETPGSNQYEDCQKEEILISGMIVLIILLTSLGSNNKVYPSMNNLFLAAPYTLWQSWRFVCQVKNTIVSRNMTFKKIKQNLIFELNIYPLKCILLSFLAICIFQFGMFGAKFMFVEGTGVRDISGTVENNEVLKGIRMPVERAEWMTEISGYVNENDLQGKEVILYGQLPALSYYLQMPSAFNPWSDLRSYSVETMKQDLAEVETVIAQNVTASPVILVEVEYARCLEYLEDAALSMAEVVTADKAQDNENDRTELLQLLDDPKWQLLMKFMNGHGYRQTFRNEKFAIYQSTLCNGTPY